ncbi:MAG: hypothetical protein JRG76_08700 [Deltaproteobacteria bacterium]|nr:hypothetical protein [Deltaproteobacteria bacterium]MBW2414572.1 hypothetical protein [Deltaproteobacteria bacterium]
MSRSGLLCSLAVLALSLPADVSAYPGGTPGYVTDVAPFCAGCHSSADTAQLAGAPPQRVEAEQIANKHLARVREAREGSGYAKLSEAQRTDLIAGIQAIDAASQVKVIAPSKVAAGSIIEVTVEATGGGGPVVGLALVDANSRWQARPAAAAGWQVVGRPRVIGPDGADQTTFTDRRAAGLAPGISYVNIYGVKADPAKGRFDKFRVIWQLRAPSQAGSASLGAVFLFGTEKGAPFGSVETVRGRAPVGGGTAASGRVKFSDILSITVE